MAQFIDRLLNDAVLGFLALLSLFLMVAPSVFEFSPTGEHWLFILEYLIVGLFLLEYLAACVCAPDKSRFIFNRWRILDLLIIVAALFALLPVGPDFLRNSPALRIFRLGRLALLGTRSGLAFSALQQTPQAQQLATNSEISVLALDAATSGFEAISWEAALGRIGSSDPDWLFMSGVTEDRLAPIAEALGVPEKAVRGLFQSSIPRFDRLERFSTLFVRYPLAMQADGRLRRTPVLLVGTADNVVVLSKEQTDLETRVEARLANLQDKTPRMVRVMLALMGEIVRAYTEVLGHLEASLLRIESELATLKDETFLTRTFELRADILRVRSSLKHLKSVMRDLSHGNLTIAGAEVSDRESFRLLADDTDDLYEGIEDLRESLQALVDLRLNVSSFQMNRVMRLLALLTALALIPATAGGLLGMNLQDTPWPGTLAQVSFGVAAGMAVSLYVFAIKGWLR
jgi:Mg2+ and Co2+ transporter CorA